MSTIYFINIKATFISSAHPWFHFLFINRFFSVHPEPWNRACRYHNSCLLFILMERASSLSNFILCSSLRYPMHSRYSQNLYMLSSKSASESHYQPKGKNACLVPLCSLYIIKPKLILSVSFFYFFHYSLASFSFSAPLYVWRKSRSSILIGHDSDQPN